MKKVGFIDYYLDEWHANHYPEMLKNASDGNVVAAYAYGMIPSPKTGKTNEEWCREHLEKREAAEGSPEDEDGMLDECFEQLLRRGWKAGVGWQDGRPFGGRCTIRMNLALPRSRVEEAMRRLQEYVFLS